MELSMYDIIKRPLITNKSVDLYKKLGQYTFEIHNSATKLMVGDAVEKLWNVKVAKVRVINVPGKIKIFGRRQFETADRKKAIISLKKGYKIDIPGLFESMSAEQQSEHEKNEAAGD